MPNNHSHGGESSSHTVMDLCLEMVELVSGKTIAEALPKMTAWYKSLSGIDVDHLTVWCNENEDLSEAELPSHLPAQSNQGNTVLDSFEDIMKFIFSTLKTLSAGVNLTSHLGISMHDVSRISSNSGVVDDMEIGEIASLLLQ